MELKLIREQYKPGSTIGRLLVDGTQECFTLEDGIRTNKVFGETAIPPGTYRITVTESPRFKRMLPRLHNVPNFEGVLIHTGNAAPDTHGCILVGATADLRQERIAASRAAFDRLFPKITAALGRGEDVSIVVVQENAPPEIAKRAFKLPGAKKPKKPAVKKAAPEKKVAPQKRSAPKRKAAPKKVGAKKKVAPKQTVSKRAARKTAKRKR